MRALRFFSVSGAAGLCLAALVGCADKPDAEPTASGITVTDAVLVAPKSGAASLSAKLTNRTIQNDEIVRIRARRGSEKLSVYEDYVWLGAGQRGTLSSTFEGSPTVVRGVKPGQTVRVTLTFKHAPATSVDVHAVADGPKYRNVAVYRHPLPTITNGRFVVVPGQRCAFVGFTIDGHGGSQHASLGDISVTGPDGRDIAWKHVTATGGPADVFASAEPMNWEPAVMAPGEVCDEPGNGDADYIDAADVKVGETVEVAIEFPAGVVRAPFKIVAG